MTKHHDIYEEELKIAYKKYTEALSRAGVALDHDVTLAVARFQERLK